MQYHVTETQRFSLGLYSLTAFKYSNIMIRTYFTTYITMSHIETHDQNCDWISKEHLVASNIIFVHLSNILVFSIPYLF